MKTQDAIDHFGGRREMAEAMDITPQSTHDWGEEPPLLRQYQLEVITKGKLRANREKGNPWRRGLKG